MTEQPLPSGWKWETLADVSEINPRRPNLKHDDEKPTSFVPMAAVDEDQGRFDRVETRPFGEIRRGYTYFEENDVVFAKITPCMENGKAAIARGLLDGFGFGTTEFHVLRPKSGVLPEWLHYYVRQTRVRQEAKEHFRGAVGQQRVPQEFLDGYPIPVPYPDDPARSLEAQRLIVARIEALFAELREARRLHDEIVADTGRVMEAALVEVFGSSRAEDWVRIGTYVDHIENGKSPSCEIRRANDDEWGVLKVGAVTYGFFNPDENKVLPPAYKPLPQYEIQTGDLLMSRANTRELVGATALVQETRRRLMLSDKIFRFRFRKDVRIVPAFLGYALKSRALRKQIEVVATGTSPSMKNISKDKVMNLMIPKFLPSRQQEIVGYLDTLQRNAAELQAIQEQMEASLVQMEQAILAQAFRGEL